MTEGSGSSTALSGVFFLSGTSALLFETLWFRQTGLAVGSSVWATAIVLAGFMAGLALGNGLAARHGDRVVSPIRLYAQLEIAVAGVGLALVWFLPELGAVAAPAYRPLLERPFALNLLRLLLCFTLLLAPSAAMGATLPLLVRALRGSGLGFGVALGRLYGWNTFGAMAGAVVGEAFAIERLGVRGTGILAAATGLVAALAALSLARGGSGRVASTGQLGHSALSDRARFCLTAAFLSGALLLALEVVWFRFFSMRVASTALVQALMLATILLGIAMGGLLASRWLRADPEADRFAPVVAMLAGTLAVATYAGFHQGDRSELAQFWRTWPDVVPPAFRLMLPVSSASGILFTLLGQMVRRDVDADSRAAGLLVMWNTLGAMLGSLIAGFVLLPLLGMERSLFGLALGYAVVAGLAWRATARRAGRGWGRPVAAGAAVLYALHLALFPFGLMERHYFRASIERYSQDGSKLMAFREGVSQTIAYLRRDFEGLGVPAYYRLVTDGYSMSATTVPAKRYMRLFAYWPVAVHPGPRQALLISYGLGVTAQALTDTPGLERIDVIDTSRDILELSAVVFPEPATHPLRDPRVRIYVEDGRQYLQTTDRRYDIITGEPPPPKQPGVVSLYTREYFQLMRSRLAPGGMVTYWLPVHSLGVEDSHGIIRGFCDAFEDCSLWTGYPEEWMLVGTNGATGLVSEERFAALWSGDASGPRLREIGVELPEQLGSLFLAGPEELDDWTRDAPPLTDDFPHRLSMRTEMAWLREQAARHRERLDPAANRRAFERSSVIARLWPEALRSRTLPYFEARENVDAERAWLPPSPAGLRELCELLTETRLRTLPLWMLGTSTSRLEALDRAAEQGTLEVGRAYWTGLGALADRSYDAAAEAFEAAIAERPGDPTPIQMRALALALAGRSAEVRAELRDSLLDDVHAPFREWLARSLLNEAG